MLSKMKLGIKILSGFMVLLALMTVIGVVGISKIHEIDDADTMLYEKVTLPIEYIGAITTNFNRIRVNVVNAARTRESEKLRQYKQGIAKYDKTINEYFKLYEKTYFSEEDKNLFEDFINEYETYLDQSNELFDLISNGKINEAVALVNGPMKDTAFSVNDKGANITKLNVEMARTIAAQNTATANSATTTMIILILIAALFSVGLVIVFMRNIAGIIKGLLDEINTISEAVTNGQLDKRSDVEAINFEFRGIGEGLNNVIDAFVSPINVMAEYVDRIAKGDIPPKITDDYKGDFNEVKNNLNGCIDVMTGLLGETEQMITAIKEGKLDIRGDSEKFIGDWGKLVNGINELTDAFVGPINVMAEYVDRIAKGDIPPKITDDYKGDFIEVKNNLNSCIDVMNGLLKESTHLIDYVQNGKLDSQANAENFIGAWKELMLAINTMVKTFVGHIDAIPAPVMLVDKEFNIEFMNNAGSNILGSTRQQLVGQKCYNQFKTSDCNTANCAIAKAMASGQKTESETDAHPNGMDLEIAYTGMPVKNLKGEVVGGLEIVIDQTEIKNAQKKAAKVTTYQSNEVDKLTAVLNKMANGDMTSNYSIEKADDDTKEVYNSFKTIEENLNKTLGSINDTLGQVNVAVDQVASGSHQVSDSSQSLSQGATEQASSLEEITASITQIGGQTKQNAENATQANQISIGARESAEQGNDQMKKMVNAMGDINESSSQISKIIKVIDEIAFQTNLLALNAAVEAARAGAHGKGFAVVADEVRNLAQRSADAAKETTELIEGSIKRVENGTNIANDTASALEEIVGNITKVTDLVGEIAGASNEQAKGVAQIGTGLEQIDQVTQANTANAEESAAASEELSGQSNQLKQMIMRFNLKNGSGNSLQSGQAEIKALAPETPKKKRKRKSKQKEVNNDQIESGNEPNPEEVIVLDDDQFGKF